MCAKALRLRVEGQTLACPLGRMSAALQRASSDLCQSRALVPECTQGPCQRTLGFCSVCFSRSVFVWGKNVTNWQLSGKHRLLQNAEKLKHPVFCMPVTPHLPPRGSGRWLRNMCSAFEMKPVLWWSPCVTQQLCYHRSCLVLFFVFPFLFLHARPEFHLAA